MLIFLLVAVIIAVLLYPYIAVAIYRYIAISRMRMSLRRIGGRIRTLRALCIFSANRASKYDLLVEKDCVLYAIKLWSCAHKNADIRIYSDGRVGEERVCKAPLSPKRNSVDEEKVTKYYARAVNKTEYNIKIPKGKKIVNVMMLYPSYRKVILECNGKERCLQSGDVFFDKIIFTPFSFYKMISESNVTEDEKE